MNFRLLFAGVLLLAVATLLSCAASGFGPGGSIYTSTKVGIDAAADGSLTGTKEGRACTSSILGWISTGDASLLTAAQSSGITTVRSVDLEGYSILGLYAELCTVVKGD